LYAYISHQLATYTGNKEMEIKKAEKGLFPYPLVKVFQAIKEYTATVCVEM
jgi:hypothetical protein